MNKLKELLDKGWKIEIKPTERGYQAKAFNRMNKPIVVVVGNDIEWIIDNILDACIEDFANDL